MHRDATIYRLRQRLLRQGLTLRPVCPGCDLQRDPHDFTPDGICRVCEAHRAAMYADALRPDGTPAVPPARDPMVDDGRDFE